MFASSILFTALASMAVAAPVAPVARHTNGAPAGWAYGYLENYETYHTRYLALDCQDKHDTEFFDQCCHPLLATESLQKDRPAQCIPSTAEVSSAVVEAATATAAGDDAASEFQAATSTVEVPSSTAESTAAPSPTADSSDNNDDSSSSSSSSSSNDNTGGFATFFYQNGNPGACGNYNSDSTPLVAIDKAWWSNFGQVSPYCGQWVQITNTQNGKTVNAQVQDVCPTCANGNSLDLSTGAFNQIASESEGSVPISWHFI